MSLLTIVTDACDMVGLPRPSTVFGNSDDSARQLLALANDEGRDLAGRHQWQALTKEASFSATGTTTQGLITSLAGSDFKFIVNNTMWDRSSTRYVCGGLTPDVWQHLKASNVSGPYPEYRLRQNYLLMIPSPSSGDSYFFEYYSRNWCQSADGATTYAAWAADDNTGILSEELMSLGLRWRYLRAKGMDYQEEYKTYRDRVNDAIARDGSKMSINLAGSQPGMPNYPEGSWNI